MIIALTFMAGQSKAMLLRVLKFEQLSTCQVQDAIPICRINTDGHLMGTTKERMQLFRAKEDYDHTWSRREKKTR